MTLAEWNTWSPREKRGTCRTESDHGPRQRPAAYTQGDQGHPKPKMTRKETATDTRTTDTQAQHSEHEPRHRIGASASA